MEKVPKIALGTFLITNEKEVKKTITFAVEKAGYRRIDTASVYDNEKAIGKALKDLFKRKVVKREELFITTKLHNKDHYPSDVAKAARLSLKNLQLDYIDLYLIHYPFSMQYNEKGEVLTHKDGTPKYNKIPLIDTWKAMEQLVKDGIVKRIGVSNFSIEQMERIRYIPDITIQPFCNQVEMHLYNQNQPLIQYLASRNIYIEAFSPFGSSPEKRIDSDPLIMNDPVLNEISKELNVSPYQLELKFLLQLGENVVVVPKSVHEKFLIENISLNFSISEENMAKLKLCERCYRLSDSSSLMNNDWCITEDRE